MICAGGRMPATSSRRLYTSRSCQERSADQSARRPRCQHVCSAFNIHLGTSDHSQCALCLQDAQRQADRDHCCRNADDLLPLHSCRPRFSRVAKFLLLSPERQFERRSNVERASERATTQTDNPDTKTRQSPRRSSGSTAHRTTRSEPRQLVIVADQNSRAAENSCLAISLHLYQPCRRLTGPCCSSTRGIFATRLHHRASRRIAITATGRCQRSTRDTRTQGRSVTRNRFIGYGTAIDTPHVSTTCRPTRRESLRRRSSSQRCGKSASD